MILFNLPELVILQGPQVYYHFDRHRARRRRPGCGGYSPKVVSREPGTVSSHGILFWVSQSPIGASSIFHPPPVVHVRHNSATYVAPPCGACSDYVSHFTAFHPLSMFCFRALVAPLLGMALIPGVEIAFAGLQNDAFGIVRPNFKTIPTSITSESLR